MFLAESLKPIEATFDAILDKYVEMNVAHPLPRREWARHPHLAGYDVENTFEALCGLESDQQTIICRR